MYSKFLNYFKDEEDNNPSFIKMTRNILVFVVVINTSLLPLVRWPGWPATGVQPD